jgi:hypothetical protein
MNLSRHLFARIARPDDEYFEDADASALTCSALQAGADVLTYWQRPPNVTRYEDDPRICVPERLAYTSVDSLDHWLELIEPAARNKFRKHLKAGVEIRRCELDDTFAAGMAAIFNESPVRQGRKFLHYGKTAAQVKAQFSRYLHREEIWGAFRDGRLIGFLFIAIADRYVVIGQLISSLHHRDCAPTNALLSCAIRRTCELGKPRLLYAYWLDDGLGSFKEDNAFLPMDCPRYWVPLTRRGRIYLALGLHRGIAGLFPNLCWHLKRVRRAWNTSRIGEALPV